MIIAGIDEAGRGPVIGPMIMSIIAINENEEHKLKELGVKDSKLLKHKERERIFSSLRKIGEHHFKIVNNDEIDAAVNDGVINLNWLEAITTIELINTLSEKTDIDKVIIDCPSPNKEKYRRYIKSRLKNKNIEILAEHKADVNHLIVGAASIISKVIRENEIKKIKKKFNIDFGSGYPHDPATIKFLKENHDKYPIFRKSWESYKEVLREKSQNKLSDF